MARKDREWGVLFSHTHDWEVEGPYQTVEAAAIQGNRVTKATGTEYVLVYRDSRDEPWVSGPERLTPREAGERKWVR